MQRSKKNYPVVKGLSNMLCRRIEMHIQGQKHFKYFIENFPSHLIWLLLLLSIGGLFFFSHERVMLQGLWENNQNNTRCQQESQGAKNAADGIFISRHVSLQTEFPALSSS